MQNSYYNHEKDSEVYPLVLFQGRCRLSWFESSEDSSCTGRLTAGRVIQSLYGYWLCDFAGFDLVFEELEDIDFALIVEATFGVVELGEGGG